MQEASSQHLTDDLFPDMNQPEFSFSFSVAQLLGLKVCLDFTNGSQPPSMTFEAGEDAYNTFNQDCSGATIKLETQMVEGRRILKLFAHDSPTSLVQHSNPPSLVSSPYPSNSSSSSSPSTSSSPLLIASPTTMINSPLTRLENKEMPSIFDWTSFATNLGGFQYDETDTRSCQSSFGNFQQGVTDQYMPSISDLCNGDLFPPTFDFVEGVTPLVPPPLNEFSSEVLDLSNQEQISYHANHEELSRIEFPSPHRPYTAHLNEQNPPKYREDSLLNPGNTHTTDISKRRKRNNKSPSQFIYHCPNPSCTRVFRSEYTCRVHSGVHNPKPRKVVHCTEVGCEETFTRQHDRLRHEVSQHGKVCEWSCPTCHRFFSSATMLQKHKCTSFKR